jgi:hypothetical protein
MSRLRVLGLALVAVFAMSAVVVAAASAEGTGDEFEFAGTATTWTGNGTSNQVFVGSAGTVECKTFTIKGNVPTGRHATTATGVPAYSSCELTKPIKTGATVTNSGCEYRFNEPIDLQSEEIDILHEGTMNITGTGCTITITVSTLCTITFAPQGPVSKLEYENSGGNLKIKAKITGLAYSQTAGSLCTHGSFTNGTYTGNSEVKEALIN